MVLRKVLFWLVPLSRSEEKTFLRQGSCNTSMLGGERTSRLCIRVCDRLGIMLIVSMKAAV